MPKNKNSYKDIIVKEGIFPYTQGEANDREIPNRHQLNKNMYFPKKLKELRNERDLTQQEVANLIGVTKSSIGLYEIGDTIPDIKTLYKLTDLFEVSADYLIGKTDVRSTNKDVAGICNITGLSERVILHLSRYLTYSSKSIVFLNYLLESDSFWTMLDYIDHLERSEHTARANRAALERTPERTLAVTDFKFSPDGEAVVLRGIEYQKYILQLMKDEFSSLLNDLVLRYLEQEVKFDGEHNED